MLVLLPLLLLVLISGNVGTAGGRDDASRSWLTAGRERPARTARGPLKRCPGRTASRTVSEARSRPRRATPYVGFCGLRSCPGGPLAFARSASRRWLTASMLPSVSNLSCSRMALQRTISRVSEPSLGHHRCAAIRAATMPQAEVRGTRTSIRDTGDGVEGIMLLTEFLDQPSRRSRPLRRLDHVRGHRFSVD